MGYMDAWRLLLIEGEHIISGNNEMKPPRNVAGTTDHKTSIFLDIQSCQHTSTYHSGNFQTFKRSSPRQAPHAATSWHYKAEVPKRRWTLP